MPFNPTTGVEQTDNDEPATPRTRSAIAIAGVPPLTGTPADIETADDIRAAHLTKADDVLTALRGGETLYEEHTVAAIPPVPVSHAQVQRAQAALNRLRHQTDAQWWLTHQHTPTKTLLDTLMDAAPDTPNAAPAASDVPAPGGAATYNRDN